MNEKKNKLVYYVDDIECGVLISTATEGQLAKKIFPQEATVTFMCSSNDDATEIAKFIMAKQNGEKLSDADLLIKVEYAIRSYDRFSDEYEFKVV